MRVCVLYCTHCVDVKIIYNTGTSFDKKITRHDETDDAMSSPRSLVHAPNNRKNKVTRVPFNETTLCFKCEYINLAVYQT